LATDGVLRTGARDAIWRSIPATAPDITGSWSRPASSNLGVKIWQKYMIPVPSCMMTIHTPDLTSSGEGLGLRATATYYIKAAADDVRDAMTKLENRIAEPGHAQSDTSGTVTSRQLNVRTKLQ
jgi:hypothetical protein